MSWVELNWELINKIVIVTVNKCDQTDFMKWNLNCCNKKSKKLFFLKDPVQLHYCTSDFKVQRKISCRKTDRSLKEQQAWPQANCAQKTDMTDLQLLLTTSDYLMIVCNFNVNKYIYIIFNLSPKSMTIWQNLNSLTGVSTD